MTRRSLLVEQKMICLKHGADFLPPDENSKLGISLNVRDGMEPVNGLRHPSQGNMCGWYIWAGEGFEERDDFFVPLHLTHVRDWHPGVLRFLALPPGWRFLFAGEYEDIWFDPTLLDT